MSLRDTWVHSHISRLRCSASDGNEQTLPAPFPGPAAPAGRAERGALRSCREACSGPVAWENSLGPRPVPPPPQAIPLDVEGAEAAPAQARTESRLLGGSPDPALGSPSSARAPWHVLQDPPPSRVPLPPQAAADPRASGKNGVLQAGGTDLAAPGVSSVLAIHLASVFPAFLFF